MPLRSLRTRLVALFLVSLTIAAFLFAAVALRQFTQEERSRARSDLSRQSLQIVKLIEEFAEKRLNGEAGAPPDFATSLGGITNTNVYFVGRGGLSAPIDEVNFGQAPKGTEERLNWSLLGKEGKAQTLNLKLADGTSTIAAAAGFRYGKPLIGAIVVARPVRSINTSTLVQGRRFVPPLLLALAAAALVALLLSRRITRPVRELTEASERIALGDYDVHLSSKGPDELGQLAHRFEQMARQLKEASEHERNFLMRISHELRTPLTAIQGHVQAISDGVIDGEDERQASLEIVLAEAGRLQRLIGDLLDLARLETRKFSLNVEEVDVVALCERAAGAQREEARARRIDLQVGVSRAARRARRRRSHPPDRHEPDHERAARDARGRRRDSRHHGRCGSGAGDRERHRAGHPCGGPRRHPAPVRDEQRATRHRPGPSRLLRARAGHGRDARRRRSPGRWCGVHAVAPAGRGASRHREPRARFRAGRRVADGLDRGARTPARPGRAQPCLAVPTWVTASCRRRTSAVAIGPPTLLSIAAATATSNAATASTMPTYSTVPCPRSACRRCA